MPRDQAYVIDLCDSVLGQRALREHRFDWLRGETGSRLPVDAYYPEIGLVVEYHERQHTEAVGFFDRKVVAGGGTRGEQRRRYDDLRRKLVPENGLALLILSYSDFAHTGAKRLKREPGDRDIVAAQMAPFRSRSGRL